MTRIFILIALLSSNLMYGQEKNDWRIGTHFQLNRGFNFFSNNKSYNGIAPGGCIEQQHPFAEGLEFTTGLTTDYRVTKNLELSSGINLTKRNYTKSINWYYFGCFHHVDLIYPFSYYRNDYSLEIPVIARYYVLPNKFKMHFELGQIAGLLLNNSDDAPSDKLKLDVHAGLGVDYFIGRFQFAASMNYRRNWQTIIQPALSMYKSNVLGIQLRTAVRLGAK